MISRRRQTLAVAVLLMVLGLGRAGGQGQGQASNGPPQVATTGVGEGRVTPDRATLFIGVRSRAASAAAAGQENARRVRAVLDTLRALGFAGEDLSTANYNVSPEMQAGPPPQGGQRVTGYVVTNTVRVEVKRLDDISRAIDASLARGANEVSSLQFYSSKADSVRRAALASAVAGARADAEVLARAAGGSLGPLLELSSTEVPIRPMRQAMFVGAAASVSTPIEPGEQVVTATVSGRWAFISR